MTLDTSKTCAHCKRTFRPGRADQDYCSVKCRQAAKYQRSKLTQQPVLKQDLPIQLAIPDGAAPYDQLFAKFSPSEQQHLQEFQEAVFQQVDRNKVLIPQIYALSIDELMLTKLNLQYVELMGRNRTDGLDDLLDRIKLVQEKFTKGMESLGISRAQQLKNKAQIKSTPAAIIAGYYDEIDRMSPETLAVFRREEARVLDTVAERVKRDIIDRIPPPKAVALVNAATEVHEMNAPEPLSAPATAEVPPNTGAQRPVDEQATRQAQVVRNEPPGWTPF